MIRSLIYRAWLRLVSASAGPLMCLLSLPAYAQVASLSSYGPNEGLPKLAADCIVEDVSRVLWVCSYVGLYRFDGDHFVRLGQEVGLGDTYITQLAPVPLASRGMWIATTGNLYFWDGARANKILKSDGSTIPFSVGHTVAALPESAVVVSGGRAFRIERGSRGWSVTTVFDPSQESARTELRDLVAVYGDGRGLWFGCGRAICFRDELGGIKLFGSRLGVPEDGWTAFLRDRGGTLWARSPRHVIALPPHADRFEERPPPAQVILATTTRHVDLAEDSRGGVLTRGDSGLLRWDGSQWRKLDTRNGLPDRSPNALLVSHQGDLWMSFSGVGVVRWRGYGAIENWGAASGLYGAPTWSIVRDQRGELLIGNERDLYRQQRNATLITRAAIYGAAPVRDIFSMVKDISGAVWISLYHGQLLKVSADEQVSRVAAMPFRLQRLLIDHRGTLWICTSDGMWSIDNLDKPVLQRVAGLPTVDFGDVAEDAAGRVWFAGKQGLFRREADGSVVRLQVTGDAPNQLFDKIAVGSAGQVWVGLDNAGLFEGHVGPGVLVELKRVDDPLLRESLPVFIRYDSRGRLWVGGSMGLDVMEGGEWLRLNENTGLLSEDTSEGAFFEDDDGSIWIGNALGVSHILHPDELFSQAPVALSIDQVERDGRSVPENAVLPWAKLPVRLTMSTPGTAAGAGGLRFRYRLREKQDNWIETTRRTLDFPALESGEQVIEVQAFDLARRKSSPVVEFHFRIHPPWWRSTPVLLLWAGLMALSAVLLWKLRLRSVRAREYQLEELVAERTRELEADKVILERTRAALQVQATHDALTGLRNRAGIIEVLGEECKRAHHSGQHLAVALLDLDHFKQVNDRHGHLAGDAVLRAVAERLRNNMRESDAVGRYGGEEILAVLPNMPPPAIERMEELRVCIRAQPVEVDRVVLAVTASIGVAWLRSSESPTDLLRRADAALYAAKRSGRDRVHSDCGDCDVSGPGREPSWEEHADQPSYPPHVAGA